ncbi:MAG: hypothetical protein ACLPYS_08290 [Vulcanimicrobiaceae bacterium]
MKTTAFWNALALAAGTALSLPAAAFAQSAAQAAPPSYAQRTGEETIHGRIASIDGKYDVQVRDERGYVDRVRLHDGTIINPTGLTLAPGMDVSIIGHNAGGTFDANEIDTPYVAYGGWYPYPYPAPYIGPAWDFGFGFGGPGYRFHGRWGW